MSKSDWTVHPNRSEIGPDEPGRNGHFRTITRPPADVAVEGAWRGCSCRPSWQSMLIRTGR